LQFFIKKKIFPSIWSSKHWIWIRIRIDLKCLIRIRIQIRIKTNADPKHRKKGKSISDFTRAGCELYVECSSLTQKNLKDVFDSAIVAGLASRNKRERKLAKKANKKPCTIL
jgi:hypothetical protein